jgi:hypothetical protein
MDVEVRPSDKPDGDPLAIVTGFYGTAIGPPGSTTPLVWTGGQADGGGNDGGSGGNGGGSGSGSNQGGTREPPKSPIKQPRPDPDEDNE